MRFHVLGGLAVNDGDTSLDLSTPKQRAVLAVLLLERDRVVSVDRFIELLWGDDADKALSSLQAYISRLRATLEPNRRPRDPASVLLSQPPGYRLAVDRASVDLYRFEDEVTAGRDLLRDGQVAEAVDALDAALRLWKGPLLPELGAEAFVVAAADRAEGVRLSAVESIAEAQLVLGQHQAAALRLEPEALEHPTRERLQGLLALALYRGDRQADALRVVDRCRRALIDSAGLDLGRDLKRLESELLAQSPALDWHDAAPARTGPARTGGDRPVEQASPRPDILGRSYELGVLDVALAEAAAGRGGVAVLVGEPGIGKTRLAEAVVDGAKARNIVTAWARCPETRSTPPFWAVTQLGDQLRAAGLIDQNLVAGDGDDPDVRERFGLYRAVLNAVAVLDRPLLLVIDDLQWADPDSLRLLEHVAADLVSSRVLVMATTRPLDDDSPSALVDCLAEIARVPSCVQLAISGLRVDDVASWLDERDDVVVPREVAELVHDRTGGNPLFVKEVIELLSAEGRLNDAATARAARAIPPGVQFVVRRRVSRLPKASQQILSIAAVIGRTFDVNTLAAAAVADVSLVLGRLEPALDAGLIVQVDGALSFSHALVADALAGEVNAVRRAAVHAAAAQSLAERAGPGFGLDAAAIAHHALEGILAGTGDLAVEASMRAARLADARFAHEDAAAHWADTALALSRCRPSDLAARIDALIEQASSLTRADLIADAKDPILAAIDTADAAGMIDRMARAATLINNAHVWANEAYGVVDTRIVHALDRTLVAHGDDDTGVRAVLLGALAAELVFAERSRHIAVCHDAEAAARATGDPVVLARVLNNIMVPNRASQLEYRRERAVEMLEIADRVGLPTDLVFASYHHVAECCVEVADFDGASRALVGAGRALQSLPGGRLRSQHHWFEAAIATATGRYDEAGHLIQRAHELHRVARRYDADALLVAGTAAIAIDHGGLDELIPLAIAATESSAYERTVGEAVAFAMLELGRPDLATSLVAPFGPGVGFEDDYTMLCTATAALHVRVELGDRVGADAAALTIASYPHRWSAAGSSPLSMGVVCLALARHAARWGDAAVAAEHFADAVQINERIGAVGWLARSLVHHGRFLIEQGDTTSGSAALARAAELATRHGLPYVQRRLDIDR